MIDNIGAGGRERQLVELLKSLDSDPRFTSSLLTMSSNIHYTGLNASNVPIFFLERKRKKDFSIFPRLYRFILSQRPDIVHTWSSMTSVYAAPITRFLNIRFINGMVRSAHENMPFMDERRIRSILSFPFSDTIISNTRIGLTAYRVPARKGVCIANGFDFNRTKQLHSKSEITNKYGIHTERIIGMVASFTDNKDYENYLNTAIRVLRERKDVTFLSIGDGPNIEKVKDMVPECHKKNIKFLGRIADVESLVNIFDIGLLMTNTACHGEGISNAIMEYMALGKPVIATNYGGNREIVVHGKSGFLVENNDPELSANVINNLLDNNELSERMGQFGMMRMKKHFTMSHMINRYKVIYMSISLSPGSYSHPSVHPHD